MNPEPNLKQGETPEPFNMALSNRGLTLNRLKTSTLQINVGLICNQRCKHCHLDAGPHRREMMDAETLAEIIAYARRARFEAIDITGGAPELNPHLSVMIEHLSGLTHRLILRSNLSALNDGNREHLWEVLKAHHVVIIASLPSLNEAQSDSQRGKGIFNISIAAIKKLNQMGYGQEGSGLELNLVSNPTGAFLPPSQNNTESRFRQILEKKWGIVFNHLFNFANVPLGRFRSWLSESGNLETYLNRLATGFNPCAVDGLMCRTLVSLSWDGFLFDCDFNLAKGLYLGGHRIHVSEMSGPPEPDRPIAVGDHCYTCTAGAGFT